MALIATDDRKEIHITGRVFKVEKRSANGSGEVTNVNVYSKVGYSKEMDKDVLVYSDLAFWGANADTVIGNIRKGMKIGAVCTESKPTVKKIGDELKVFPKYRVQRFAYADENGQEIELTLDRSYIPRREQGEGSRRAVNPKK